MEENKSSERERDPKEIALLKRLREGLFCPNISKARLSAFNLSWKQEDGLAILTEALLGDYERTAKKAAAYGLRSMRGRMQKLAAEVLEKGLEHRDKTTKAACIKSLAIIRGEVPPKAPSRRRHSPNRRRISNEPNGNVRDPMRRVRR